MSRVSDVLEAHSLPETNSQRILSTFAYSSGLLEIYVWPRKNYLYTYLSTCVRGIGVIRTARRNLDVYMCWVSISGVERMD